MILSIKGITKALIRLGRCAGWSVPLLFANTGRQVFSCRGPYTVKHLFLVVIFIWWFWQYKQKSPKNEPSKYRFKFSYTNNKWTHILCMLLSVALNLRTVEYVSPSRKSCLQMAGLEKSTRPLVFASASGYRASESFDIPSEIFFSHICQ